MLNASSNCADVTCLGGCFFFLIASALAITSAKAPMVLEFASSVRRTDRHFTSPLGMSRCLRQIGLSFDFFFVSHDTGTPMLQPANTARSHSRRAPSETDTFVAITYGPFLI